jgi:hypothetical protein
MRQLYLSEPGSRCGAQMSRFFPPPHQLYVPVGYVEWSLLVHGLSALCLPVARLRRVTVRSSPIMLSIPTSSRPSHSYTYLL